MREQYLIVEISREENSYIHHCTLWPSRTGDMKEEMIHDRLVIGIRDCTSERLQLDDAELTLEKEREKKSCAAKEAVLEQQLEGTAKSNPIPWTL